jgi:hypothetical protein
MYCHSGRALGGLRSRVTQKAEKALKKQLFSSEKATFFRVAAHGTPEKSSFMMFFGS